MPAAAWAARSGDVVLFAQRDSVPEPTLEAIERNKDVPLYVLGPEKAISKEAFEELKKAADSVTRVEGKDPVSNSVEFARFTDGSFGWNINDPGHGFVLLNGERPADAGAAASLSASGTWGPALVTDSAEELPGALRGYLLDLKPGYQDDPTRGALQPRLGDRGPGRDLGALPGAGRRACGAGQGRVRHRKRRARRPAGGTRGREARQGLRRRPGRREAMSEREREDRLSGREITIEDVRALAGPATPHFALQIRNRIARLIESLPPEHPARVEGEQQIARLTQLAEHSGEPRHTV